MQSKCSTCGQTSLMFAYPTLEKPAYVVCSNCYTTIDPGEVILLDYKNLDLDRLGVKTPWTLEPDGYTKDPVETRYAIEYIAGENCVGPLCKFYLPDELSRILSREFTRGYETAKKEIRSKLGL